jgi:hypothetical protein
VHPLPSAIRIMANRLISEGLRRHRRDDEGKLGTILDARDTPENNRTTYMHRSVEKTMETSNCRNESYRALLTTPAVTPAERLQAPAGTLPQRHDPAEASSVFRAAFQTLCTHLHDKHYRETAVAPPTGHKSLSRTVSVRSPRRITRRRNSSAGLGNLVGRIGNGVARSIESVRGLRLSLVPGPGSCKNLLQRM